MSKTDRELFIMLSYRYITGLVHTRFSIMVSFSKSIGIIIACSAKEASGIRSETLQVMTRSLVRRVIL